MEIVALITINIAFGVGLYIVVSAKLTKILKESQGTALEKKIRTIQSEFIRQTDLSYELLERKTKGLRDLVDRSDRILEILKVESGTGTGVSIQLQNLINQVKDILDGRTLSDVSNGKLTEEFLSSHRAENSEQINQPTQYRQSASSVETKEMADTFAKKDLNKVQDSLPISKSTQTFNPDTGIVRGITNAYIQNKITKPEISTEGYNTSSKLIAGLGRKVMSMMGADKLSIQEDARTIPEKRPSETNKLAYLIDNDPFEGSDSEPGFRDLEEEKRLEEGSFLSTFKSVTENKNYKDQIVISPSSVLEELPASATKIDKVVLLLKKGYSYDEIGDTLDLGTREVKLIETIRMDKSRRR
ncbi:hypothetical protein [Leptospira sp. GIMC2001]|uniref:hypothetical protein n=1 Tax=Leptospira sp. GIMC2001 TaxID=1513297 RepID=UPI0023498113|nr:hypothetical protein [Leptospira sp. GIMC2001]WCL48264.1 hypothetical protein O4O04_13220 [Leptospira sp. GIMC2001]